MLSLYRSRFYPGLATLLVCLIAWLAMRCACHLVLLTHAHQTSADSHQHPADDAPGDNGCLIAVLPALGYFPTLLGVVHGHAAFLCTDDQGCRAVQTSQISSCRALSLDGLSGDGHLAMGGVAPEACACA